MSTLTDPPATEITTRPTSPASGGSRRPVLLATFFVMAVCSSILAIEAWRIVSARTVQIGEGEVAATNLAKSIAAHASGTFVQVDMLLSGLTERLDVDGTEPAALDRIHRLLREQVRSLPQLERLSVIDPYGHKITSDLDDNDASVDHSDRAYFRYHAAHTDDAPYLGPPIESRLTKRWIITVSRRFNLPNGGFAGVVVASINMDYFDDYYRQFDIGKDGTIVLVMSNGVIMERRPFKEKLIGTSLAKGTLFTQHIAYDENGIAHIKSAIDGIDRQTAFQKVGIFPAYAVVAFADDYILGDWQQDSLVHALAAIALVITLGVIGLRLIAQISKRHADQLTLIASQDELQALNARLDSLAREDGLTGLANRREFDRVLEKEVKRVARSGESLALIMIDIDHFKEYNDFFGHLKGDDCIRMVADRVSQSASRPGDLAARYGGEEFVLLLPSTDADGASTVAEEIRLSLHRAAISHPRASKQMVTASFGISASLSNARECTPQDLVDQADKALYAAKEIGRDSIRVFREFVVDQKLMRVSGGSPG